jgi:raffinose/stachyose/melibiose transport system permease protein
VFLLFLSGMMVPVHVTLIPLLKLMQALGLHDTRVGLVAVYVAFSLPVAVVLLAAFFREIPRELEDAAEIDGCGQWGKFLYVALPLARPAVIGVAMLTLVNVWNEFVLALVLLQDPAKLTLPLGVRNLRGEFGANVPLMAAALTVAVVPPLVVYALAQRHLIRGLTAGAVKG